MLPQAKTCLICNAPLSFHQALTSKFCGKEECRRKQLALPKQPACAVCGRQLSPQESAAQVCSGLKCQATFFGERRLERERQWREALTELALKLRDQGAQAEGISAPASYPLTVIPSFTYPVVNLPQRR